MFNNAWITLGDGTDIVYDMEGLGLFVAEFKLLNLSFIKDFSFFL